MKKIASMKGRGRARLLAMAFFLAALASAGAQGTGQKKAELLPERFLREYDTVTLSLEKDTGPAKGGPGDDASSILSIRPAHPGEYRWLDARTLQFLPSEPWPALRTFSFRSAAGVWERATLMSPPTSLSPSPGGRGLSSFDSLSLTFPRPLPQEDLERMLSFEIRALPGLGSQDAQIVDYRGFSIKELDRSDRKSPASYRLSLDRPVADGKSVTLKIKLSLDEGIPGSVATYSWQTRTDFRVLSFGSGGTSWPVSSSGSSYPADQAVNCGSGDAPLAVTFSEAPSRSTAVALLKSMVSFTPAVRNLRMEVSGTRLLLSFDRDPDTDYLFSLSHADLKSESGRSLAPFADSSFHFYYTGLSPFVKWGAGQAILERLGPRLLPMSSRGVGKVDLRIHAIDPLDRDFFPFPQEGVRVDESAPPPMPGEEEAASSSMASRIRLLGSPEFSQVVSLPAREGGPAASYGLDIGPFLERVSGKAKPGTYLVGYRALGASTERHWMRVQVTDLSLTVVEERRGIVFAATSLATGKPLAGAELRVEGYHRDREYPDGEPEAIISGKTDREGRLRWEHRSPQPFSVLRVSLSLSDDRLVLTPTQAPPYFHDKHWFGSRSGWLSWISSEPYAADEAPRSLAWIQTERPIYRANEPVHIQGWIRSRVAGLIKRDLSQDGYELFVNSPDGNAFRYPVTLTGNGSFYQRFEETELPSGSYEAVLAGKGGSRLASVSFSKEEYRVPSFELNLSGPERVPFDQPFEILLTASYYAGGKVAGQAVSWSVTEGSWAISPSGYDGYSFSSYLSSGSAWREEGRSASEGEDRTDDTGSARLRIDPRTAESVNARSYTVQAEVTGADAQTVAHSMTVRALPPFAIGLKLPRFETEELAVRPSIVVIDQDEKPLAGKDIVLRLHERQWHSYLSETDIATGEAKYVSDVVDVQILERKLTSAAAALELSLPVSAAGVYIVEVQGRDAEGRLQSVKRDLFVSGPGAVAWKRGTAAVFETSLDKGIYAPGDVAKLLLQSPFQSAMALIVVERPTGNEYRWVEVKEGKALMELPITEDLVPRFPVHAALMRGRLPGEAAFDSGQDRLRPLTVANTTWVAVDPASNRLEVRLSHKGQALPGSDYKIEATVRDRAGKAVDGELTLWLVDRAVLALAPERFASPLAAFITEVLASVRMSDTRNLAVGNLPFEEAPGGDWAEGEARMAFEELLERTTVRRNFQTVPYYAPALTIKDGKAEALVKLPDNLTEFAIRAVASSGYDKFGTAKSVVALRLPVLVQESLPRFVRPGDRAVAGGIARVIDGTGGMARAELKLEGGWTLDGGSTTAANKASLDPVLPTKLLFNLKVPMSLSGTVDALVSITLGILRMADSARDAFMLQLPVRDDAISLSVESQFEPGTKGQEYPFPAPSEAARPGSVTQTAWLSANPDLVAALKTLRFQASYPYGCTEQRIAKVHAAMALQAALGEAGMPAEFAVPPRYVKDLMAYLSKAISRNGLYAPYPGSTGYVYLTSYVIEFLMTARAAGHAVPAELLSRPVQALKEALRSDYDYFSHGYDLQERAMALLALDAAGSYDRAYGTALLEAAQEAEALTQARIWLTLNGKKGVNAAQLKRLKDKLKGKAVFKKMEGGRLAFTGLQEKGSWFSHPFLYSDHATTAALYSVFETEKPGSAEAKAIMDWLLAQAGPSGWGDTYTNTRVLTAVAQAMGRKARKPASAELWDGKAWRPLDLSERSIVKLSVKTDQPLKFRMKSWEAKDPPGFILETRFVPVNQQASRSGGFAVTEELIDYGDGKGEALKRWSVEAGKEIALATGKVVEVHVRVTNSSDRNFAAVRVPLAAGWEPMNPALATAPKEAKPSGALTRSPAYADYEDHQVTFYYDLLPKGSYDFYFRVRPSFEGSYSLPPARAQMLYDMGVFGISEGATILITEGAAGK